jgi:hypothetical protein
MLGLNIDRARRWLKDAQINDALSQKQTFEPEDGRELGASYL